MEVYLYGMLSQNVAIINYSSQRVNFLIDINLQITNMMLITNATKQRLLNPNLPSTYYTLNNSISDMDTSFISSESLLYQEASNLKDAQTGLTNGCTDLSSSTNLAINPNSVSLEYMNAKGMPKTFTFTVWQAIMEIVVASYKISTMNTTQVDDNVDATVFFVSKNSMNNVIVNLDISSGAIMNETEQTRQLNLTVFLILLCVASFALVLSTALLVPVLNKVKKNKQDVFELFMHIKKSEANQELKKCRNFLGTFQANQDTELIVADGEDEKQEGEDQEESTIHVKKGLLDNRGMPTFRRKYKKLSLNLGLVIFKFVFLILLMEGYFLMDFFLSTTFLSRVYSLTQELNQLISRLPTHSLLLLIEKYGEC